MTPIIGFAPDSDQTTQGIISDCENIVPANVGISGAPTPVTPENVPSLSDACQGIAVVVKLDGTRRTIAGTADAIYELASGSWLDVSDTGGYSGGSDSVWSIAQFGDATLMSNRAEAIQRSTSGAFVAISGAPKAQIIFSVGAFVMALNVNDGSEKTDGWHCCASFDDTDWTESTITQSASGRLVSAPGVLTAGARLGDYAVAYKERAIYIGQYVGGEEVWHWQLVSGGDAGCVGKRAICDIDGTHFFVGPDNFWLFNGTSVIPLGDGVLRDWFSENCSSSYRYKTICSYDKTKGIVRIFYPSPEATECDSTLCYHVLTKRWGRANVGVQAAVEFVSGAITIDGLDAIASTIDDLPDIPFDSPYWNAGDRSAAIINTSNQLQLLVGQSASSSFTTGDYGNDYDVSRLVDMRLRFALAPTSASAQGYKKMISGASYDPGASATMSSDGKFDFIQTGRWHKVRFSFSGDFVATGMNANSRKVGLR